MAGHACPMATPTRQWLSMAVPLAITFKGQDVGPVWSVVSGMGHNPHVKVSKVNNPIELSNGFSVNNACSLAKVYIIIFH